MSKIYCLRDVEGRVRYIGKTSEPRLVRRLQMHLLDAKSGKRYHRLNWLRSLPVPPTIEELEGCPPMQWQARERYWIALARDYGCKLVNSTAGGDICPDNTGKKDSDETRARKSAALKGVKKTAAHCAAMSAVRKGRPLSPEHAANIKASSSQRGRPLSAKQRGALHSSRINTLVSKNTSGYRGVSLAFGKWKAQICVQRQKIYLGLFADIVDAAKAADAATIKHQPPGAYLNFPQTK